MKVNTRTSKTKQPELRNYYQKIQRKSTHHAFNSPANSHRCSLGSHLPGKQVGDLQILTLPSLLQIPPAQSHPQLCIRLVAVAFPLSGTPCPPRPFISISNSCSQASLGTCLPHQSRKQTNHPSRWVILRSSLSLVSKSNPPVSSPAL